MRAFTMLKLGIWFLIFHSALLIGLPPASAQETNQTIYLAPGLSRTIQFDKLSSVVISNGQFAKLITRGNQLTLIGRRIGQANIQINARTNIELRVISNDIYRQLRRFEQAMESMRGLKVRPNANGLNVSGVLFSIDDWEKIAQVQIDSGVKYTFQAKIFPPIKPEIEDFLERELRGLPPYNLRLTPFPLLSSKNTKDLEKSKLIQRFGLTLTDHETIGQTPMIKTTLLISEVTQTGSHQLGLDWQTSISTSSQRMPYALNDLEVTLTGMEKSGSGRVLAAPHLLSRAGQEAQFHSGGELPIVRVLRNNQSVKWKPYGLTLKATPQVNSQNQVRVLLATELSFPDLAHASAGVPGLSIHRLNTELEVQSGQSVAVGGLIRNDLGSSVNGVRWLSTIPILKNLFASESFLERKSQVLVFVCPQVLTTGVTHE